ncbi:MAG TPA: dihydrofolate reductase family protein [Trueperaceae bacterium]
MKRIRYQVASSLDGYIAGPNGEYDWIPMDPGIDFSALFDQFDTLLMGRRTYEELSFDAPEYREKQIVVFSRTLRQQDHPDVRIIPEASKEVVDEFRAGSGKDIWLYGGGELFRALLDLGCVDTVEPAVVPVLLGGGRPLLPTPAGAHELSLTRQRVYHTSGIVMLEYDVAGRLGRQG